MPRIERANIEYRQVAGFVNFSIVILPRHIRRKRSRIKRADAGNRVGRTGCALDNATIFIPLIT